MGTTNTHPEVRTEVREELMVLEARRPFRIAAGVLAFLTPLGLIPLGADLAEAGGSDDYLLIAAGLTVIVVCGILFAKTALGGGSGEVPVSRSVTTTTIDRDS